MKRAPFAGKKTDLLSGRSVFSIYEDNWRLSELSPLPDAARRSG